MSTTKLDQLLVARRRLENVTRVGQLSYFYSPIASVNNHFDILKLDLILPPPLAVESVLPLEFEPPVFLRGGVFRVRETSITVAEENMTVVVTIDREVSSFGTVLLEFATVDLTAVAVLGHYRETRGFLQFLQFETSKVRQC
jgi:hypothetical protein